MLGLSIADREAAGRLIASLLFVLALALFGLGRVAGPAVDRARVATGDFLAPAYAAATVPVAAIRSGAAEIGAMWALRREMDRLRTENAAMLRWQAAALALEQENRSLKAALHWLPDQPPDAMTGRVVADAGGIYSRAVLLEAMAADGVRPGDVALDAGGLVGRVTEVGARSARIMLLTDPGSRVPVMLHASDTHAILAGTNGALPRLTYWQEGMHPVEGERVVTGAEAGAFPAGLPVGTVHYVGAVPYVTPYAQLERLDVVRVLGFGRRAVAAPDAPLPASATGGTRDAR